MLIEDDIYANLQSVPSTRLTALDGLERLLCALHRRLFKNALRVGFLVAPTTKVKPLVTTKMLTSIVGDPSPKPSSPR